jgi:hypothetical protein
MSKQRPEKPVEKPVERVVEKPQTRVIEEHRHCPICWSGNGGYGTAYSTQGQTRYYKCNQSTTDKGPCGHTWTVLVKLEVIRVEHRIVSVEGQR